MDHHDRSRTLHLPRFKRPPGWSALDANAVRSRAAQAFIAFENPPISAGARTADGVMPSGSKDQADQGVAGADAPGEHQHIAAPSVADSCGSNAEAHAKSGFTRGHRLYLLAFLLGGVVLAPWVVWAPVLGGISFGLLLIQTGLLQRWLMPAAPVARSIGSIVPDNQGAQIESRRSTRGSGWLLVAVLILFGVQTLMLLTTLNIKSREPALSVQALQGSQRERAELRRRLDSSAPTLRSERDQIQDRYSDVSDDALEPVPSSEADAQ